MPGSLRFLFASCLCFLHFVEAMETLSRNLGDVRGLFDDMAAFNEPVGFLCFFCGCAFFSFVCFVLPFRKYKAFHNMML